VIVRAAHRVRGELSRLDVVLERVEGLVTDDRLGNRDARRADRKLEHSASLAVGGCRRRHGRA
jgi:hypothetical protein